MLLGGVVFVMVLDCMFNVRLFALVVGFACRVVFECRVSAWLNGFDE